jgi:hypothetical protein
LSILTHIEKQKLERELSMQGGRVLQFTRRTFEEFFKDVIGVQISDSQYDYLSGSQADRMRAFWQQATQCQIKAFLCGLREGWDIYSDSTIPTSAKDLINQILSRIDRSDTRGAVETTEPRKLADSVAQILLSRLIELSAIPPKKRGFQFERFLKDLFDAYQLGARASFRLMGEQIDGSFVLHNQTYLLEAKWENAPTGAADLHIFEGKLGEKAVWSRGLFISNSGFSPEGLHAFGRGKRLICMDGFDLSEILKFKIPLTEALDAKVRRAAESGAPYTPVRELIF